MSLIRGRFTFVKARLRPKLLRSLADHTSICLNIAVGYHLEHAVLDQLDTSNNLAESASNGFTKVRVVMERGYVGADGGVVRHRGTLRELSAKGDDLERVKALVDLEMFRPATMRAAFLVLTDRR